MNLAGCPSFYDVEVVRVLWREDRVEVSSNNEVLGVVEVLQLPGYFGHFLDEVGR